jgi:Helix-turn-helix domain
MTPNHQKLIDQLLLSADRHARALLTELGYQPSGRNARIEELRASPVGQHLANLANYSEGYSPTGDIREAAQFVSLYFHALPLRPRTFKFPENFHQTDLGKLINEAMVRFYEEERPGQLLTMEDMRQLFGVTRQTVHQWIRAGDIIPVYINNTSRFYRKDVDRLMETQQHKRASKRCGHRSPGVTQ